MNETKTGEVMMRLIQLLNLMLVLCTSPATFASELDSEAYIYTDTAISVYAKIRDASFLPISQNQNGYDGDIAILRDAMKKSIIQTQVFKSAHAEFSRFSKSSDPDIQASASFPLIPILMLQITSEHLTSEYEKILNMPPKKLLESRGTIFRKIFELQKADQSNWELYAKTAGAVTFGLTDSTKLDEKGKLRYLKITADEQQKLKDKLLLSFGYKIENGITTDSYMSEIPAIVLWEFLNDKWLVKEDN